MGYVAQAAQEVAGTETRAHRQVSWRSSPYAVGALVLVLYGLWCLVYALGGYSAQDLTLVSKLYATQSHVSTVISYDPRRHQYAHNRVGYDGQFFYFLALDPIHARYYVDNPAYRYTKILYPMTARTLALGQPTWIPYTLLLINWLAVGAGTVLVGLWLRRRRLSVWIALAYGLFPGVFIGFQRDLTEPLSYALVAFAVYLLDRDEKRNVVVPAVVFALAVLTRDKAVVFPLLYSAGLFFDGLIVGRNAPRFGTLVRNTWRAGLMIGIAAGPLVLWKIILLHWMKSMTLASESGSVAPLKALTTPSMMNGTTLVVVLTAVVPGFICGGMALWALYRPAWDINVWILLVVVVFSVVTLDPQFYRDLFGMFRVSTAVMLWAIYCLPVLDRVTGGRRWWLWSCFAGWYPIPLTLALFGPLYILHGTGS